MKKLILSAIGALALTTVTSCSNNEYNSNPVLITLDFTIDSEYYNLDGYWADVYNPEQGAFGIAPGVIFSHKAEVTEYDGVEYRSFTGFCPTIVDDQADHSNADWTQYQFASIAEPKGFGYLIAHWDVRENNTTLLDQRSCCIDYFITVNPVAMTLTNTAYTYYVMKNGSAFSRPFGPDDFLALDIYGVNKGVAKFFKTEYLAQNGEFVENWKTIDLTGIGEVDKMYFTMRSSDTGEWGMNTPAYFAIGSIQILYPGTAFN